jgi:hypothetical protein
MSDGSFHQPQRYIGGALMLFSGAIFLVKGLEIAIFQISFYHYIIYADALEWIRYFIGSVGYLVIGALLLLIAARIVLAKSIGKSSLFIGVVSAVTVVGIYEPWFTWFLISDGPPQLHLSYQLNFVFISLLLQCGALVVGTWLTYTAGNSDKNEGKLISAGSLQPRGRWGVIFMLIGGTTFLIRGLEAAFHYFSFTIFFADPTLLESFLYFLVYFGYTLVGILLLILTTRMVSGESIKRVPLFICAIGGILLSIFYETYGFVLAFISTSTPLYYILCYSLYFSLLCGTLLVGSWLVYTARTKVFAWG